MRYLLALIIPPFAILTCGKPLSFAFNVIVYGLAWVCLMAAMFVTVIPFLGLGTLAPLPLAFVSWVLAALHAVLVISARETEKRQRESGGKPTQASAAFDWMLLVLVCAYFGWRLFFHTAPADSKAMTSAPQATLPQKAATPAPAIPTASAVPAERAAAPSASLDAQQRAVAAFPALGVAGSPLNREFVARHQRYKLEKPEMFTDPEWPLQLARECARDIAATKSPAPD